MSETALKEKSMTWLRQQGCYVIKVHGDFMQERGVLDLFGILPGGRGFILELKVPGQKPSELQEYHMEQAAAAGAAVGCSHSLQETKDWYARAMAEARDRII